MINTSIVNSLVLRSQVYLECQVFRVYQAFRVYQVFQDSKAHKLQHLPPSFIPQQSTASPFAVDPGAISLCLFRNTYIWLSNGEQFWYFPIFVGPRSVAGFRWNGRFWVIFGIDTRRIISFTCF